jgi:predicted dehydrogenase
MQRLRVAVVGAGTGRGQRWLSTLRKLTELSSLYELCALCEVLPERARENANRWGVKGYTSLPLMLEAEKPDVVLNGAPSDSNPVVVGLCAQHGAHVITEIPIAPTLSMADWMIATVSERGLRLEIAEQVWLWAKEQLKQEIIRSGLIGKLTHARLWYVNKAEYHGFNAMRMLIGAEAKRVLGYEGKALVPKFVGYEGDLVTEDYWHAALIEFDSGLACIFEDPPRGRLAARWDIEGSEGQLMGDDLYLGSTESTSKHYPLCHEYTSTNGRRVLDCVYVATEPPLVFENPFKCYEAEDDDEVARMQLLAGFHRAIVQAGCKPVYGPENARKDLELCLAIRESARLGSTWVDLPLRGPTELERKLEEEFRRMYGHPFYEVEALAQVQFPRGGVRWRVAGWD